MEQQTQQQTQQKKDLNIEKKIKTLPEVLDYVKPYKKEKTIGFICGCFDCLHPGHVQMINEASTYVDILIVAVNSDTSVKQLKGESRPIITEKDRAMILASLQSVDVVTIFQETTVLHILEKLKPTYFIKSNQYSFETLLPKEQEIMLKHNIQGLFLEFKNGYSSTHIINRIESAIKGISCVCADRLSKKG